MRLQEQLQIVGMIRADAAGGAVAVSSVGPVIGTVARTGAGVYTVTLANNVQCDATERFAMVSVRKSGAWCHYEDTSDTVITIKTWDDAGNANDDTSFTLVLFRTRARA